MFVRGYGRHRGMGDIKTRYNCILCGFSIGEDKNAQKIIEEERLDELRKKHITYKKIKSGFLADVYEVECDLCEWKEKTSYEDGIEEIGKCHIGEKHSKKK